MKRIEEMSDHELLMELIEDKRRNDKIRFIIYAVFATLAVLIIGVMLVYIPRMIQFMNQYKALMEDLENATNSIKDLKDSLDFDSLSGVQDMISKVQEILAKFGLR